MIDWIHPGLVLILGAVLVPFLRGRAKRVYLIALPSYGPRLLPPQHRGHLRQLFRSWL